MKCGSVVVLAAALLLAFGAGNAFATDNGERERVLERGGVVFVHLPNGFSRRDAVLGAPSTRKRLSDAARRRLNRLAVAGGATLRQAPATDRIVVFVDGRGRAILPDRRRRDSVVLRAGAAAATDLTFTFDSAEYAWSSTDVATMKSAIETFYPIVKTIYGDPAFSARVNVRRDPTITFSGYYSPSLNEIVLPDADVDALVHEMIHSFRDDYLVGLSTWEEGMTRAAEVEAFNVADAYSHWDERHSYTYDVYYDGLNTAAIGAKNGNIFAGYASALLRYQLAGYAWGKALIENSAFLRDFNSELYRRAAADIAVRATEAQLVSIAAAVQPEVEGTTFTSWYIQQGVLNTAPPTGDILYHRINQFTVDFFHRDDSGIETPYPSAIVGWSVTDVGGGLLASGEATTTSTGWISFVPVLPISYEGTIDVAASAATSAGTIRASRPRSFGSEAGVFGVVPGSASGTITFTGLDSGGVMLTTPVVTGAFSAPSLVSARGRFEARFEGPSGETFSRRFTKDASDYQLLMVPSRPLRPDLADSSVADPPRLVSQNESFATADTVINVGTDTAGPSFTLYYLSPDQSYSASDILVGSRPNASIGPGERVSASQTVTVPDTTPVVRSYYVLACADGTGMVNEIDEANNCASSSATVRVKRKRPGS
jgi:hypothetical protein